MPAIAGIVDSALMIISVTGHSKICALHSCLRLLVMLCIIPLAGLTWGVEGIVRAYFAGVLLLLPVPFFYLVRIVPVSGREIVARVWRPILAGIGMLLVVNTAHWQSLTMPALRLGLDVGIGAAAYLAIAVALWFVVGRPDGPEATVIRTVARRMNRSGTTA